LVIYYSTILHLSVLKWYKFGNGTGMGLQNIGSRVYPWYGNYHAHWVCCLMFYLFCAHK